MSWLNQARIDQLTPLDPWHIWLILAGRGWGKTRTGAEDIAAYSLWNPGVRVAVVAPTFASGRDICVEGESGLLSVIPHACIAGWHRSMGELILGNGARIKVFSADEPERLRGPQHHRAWCDELGAWATDEAFDQLAFGLRLGTNPQVIVTTTPRNQPLIRRLVAREGQDVYLTRGSTYDNSQNLAATALAQLEERYAGTRLGRQELEAELLTDTQGALWTHALLDEGRCKAAPALEQIVIGVDPALSCGPASDETGIIAAGRAPDGSLYVLEDWSGRFPPDEWARRVFTLYEKVQADLIVGEVNAGGALVERLLRQINPLAPFKPVRALKGKIERALPVAALYEQGRVHHVGVMHQLEDQMTRFAPEEIAAKSPDRVDAMVWALNELSPLIRNRPRIRGL